MISPSSDGNPPRYIILSDGLAVPASHPVTYTVVPDDGHRYVRVLHDWEHAGWDYKARAAAGKSTPETCPLWPKNYPTEFFQMNWQYQRLWFDMLVWASQGTMTISQLKTAWANITAERKALTDNHSRGHHYTDYILEMYLDSKKNMFQKCLVFGGSVLRVVSKGSKYYHIECVNMNAPVPTLEHLLRNPHLFGWLTEINGKQKPDKTYPVSNWPDLEKWGGWGVPYIIIGNETTNRIERSRVAAVSPGDVIPIYN